MSEVCDFLSLSVLEVAWRLHVVDQSLLIRHGDTLPALLRGIA
jgi:hypothetical protein